MQILIAFANKNSFISLQANEAVNKKLVFYKRFPKLRFADNTCYAVMRSFFSCEPLC